LASTREHAFGNPFPFTKRLRRYLTDEQNAILESLPPLSPTIDSAIDGYVAFPEVLIPRARKLAEGTGARGRPTTKGPACPISSAASVSGCAFEGGGAAHASFSISMHVVLYMYREPSSASVTQEPSDSPMGS
jgi:hypothetical protein